LLKEAADSDLIEAQVHLTRGLVFLAPRIADRKLLAESLGMPLFTIVLALLRSGQRTVLELIAARIEDVDRPDLARPIHAFRIPA